MSLGGTAVVSRNFLNFGVSLSPDNHGLCSKQLSSKCMEHRWEVLEGFQPGQCLRTNFVHFSRLTGSDGNLSMVTCIVNWEFLQLVKLGPLAAQYLPSLFLPSSSAIMPAVLSNRFYVTTL